MSDKDTADRQAQLEAREEWPFFTKADLFMLETAIRQFEAAKRRAYQRGEDEHGDLLAKYVARLNHACIVFSRML